MNIYSLTKKEISAYEKEFSKTAFGKKVRIPTLLSLMSIIIWFIVVIGYSIISYNCYNWAKGTSYSYYSCNPDCFSNSIIIGVITFLIITFMCIFSVANYNKELRKFIQSK